MLSLLLLAMSAVAASSASRGTVIVTGGSRGIGAACCKRLARDGYTVIVNYKSSQGEAVDVVGAIKQDGGDAITLQADVSSEAGVVDMFASIDNWIGSGGVPPLTALVNNAGVIGDKEALDAVTPAAFEAMMATNVLGPLLCCKEAEKRMAPGSAIVNLSSGSAYIGTPLLYSMSKGALNSMQHGLIKPLAAKGIRINTVSPGVTDTDMVAGILDDPERKATMEAQIPLGRAGRPEEIAGAVAYLLSPDAAYTSGANIRVAGGRGPGTTLG